MKKFMIIAAALLLAACDGGEEGKKEGDENGRNGKGTITNSFAPDKPVEVVRAEQVVRSTEESGVIGCEIRLFDKDENRIDLPLTIFEDERNVKLHSGQFVGFYYGHSPKNTYFYVHQKGVIGGEIYYYWDDKGSNGGGIIEVSVDGSVYTLSLEIITTSEGGNLGKSGKITGSYTGPIPVVND